VTSLLLRTFDKLNKHNAAAGILPRAKPLRLGVTPDEIPPAVPARRAHPLEAMPPNFAVKPEVTVAITLKTPATGSMSVIDSITMPAPRPE
jgi:hypothetical protein